MEQWVLHVDLDQFIAAVEILRRPELAGLPVVVGGRGDPTERGVVATASYAAREHGVGSGMPLRIAARKIPDAVFLPVDKDAYNEASDRVMATLRSLTWGGVPVVVEVLGWDEAFLGPGEGHGELGDPRVFAQHIRSAVQAATQLTCGVGIGDNKLRAKIATAFGKAGEGDGSGIGYLTAAEWYDVMGDRPTTALWGIGSKIGKRLAALESTRSASSPTPTRECWPRRSGRRWGRGTTGSAVAPTPARSTPRRGCRGRTAARRPTRPTWGGTSSRTSCARSPHASCSTSIARAGRRRGSGSRCATGRSSPSVAR